MHACMHHDGCRPTDRRTHPPTAVVQRLLDSRLRVRLHVGERVGVEDDEGVVEADAEHEERRRVHRRRVREAAHVREPPAQAVAQQSRRHARKRRQRLGAIDVGGGVDDDCVYEDEGDGDDVGDDVVDFQRCVLRQLIL
eukprot:GHVU01219272.1.p1 GENE.GHVU01219272.1~~GHVU01219272.1.p1  ORF type:complete len:139 (+),score=16.05 GHVU01219272.1:292-708(+)